MNARAAVGVTEEGSRRSQEGMGLVQAAGESIRKLAQAMVDSSQSVKQIAASTKQQSAGVEQIAQAVQDISQAATASVAGSKSLETAARTLKELADEMARLVSQYRTTEAGPAAPAQAA